jgi:hypothetical protein
MGSDGGVVFLRVRCVMRFEELFEMVAPIPFDGREENQQAIYEELMMRSKRSGQLHVSTWQTGERGIKALPLILDHLEDFIKGSFPHLSARFMEATFVDLVLAVETMPRERFEGYEPTPDHFRAMLPSLFDQPEGSDVLTTSIQSWLDEMKHIVLGDPFSETTYT